MRGPPRAVVFPGGRGGNTRVTSTTEMIISRNQLDTFDSDTGCQPAT
ncbi:hypothetical protein [Microbacterium sp. 8M]|nr:hypothetical protein [Microbacterium sp. 8M]